MPLTARFRSAAEYHRRFWIVISTATPTIIWITKQERQRHAQYPEKQRDDQLPSMGQTDYPHWNFFHANLLHRRCQPVNADVSTPPQQRPRRVLEALILATERYLINKAPITKISTTKHRALIFTCRFRLPQRVRGKRAGYDMQTVITGTTHRKVVGRTDTR